MSAMSASPVKPVLPPTGVNVPPPVVTSPPKVGIPIPATLTIAPAKPANMNHSSMPLSLISEHKMSPFPPQSQTGIPPAMQPLSQPLPRTPEKPKELTGPVVLPAKPTSNGMEGLILPSQPPATGPTPPDTQISTPVVQPQKVESSPLEIPENNALHTPPVSANTGELPIAAAAPPMEPDIEKKEETATTKPVEPVSEASVPPVVVTQDASSATTISAFPVVPVSIAALTPTPAAAAATPSSVAVSTLPVTPVTKPPTPPPEQPVPPVVTPSVSRTESSLPHSKPEIKVATIPRQAAKRKRDPKITSVTPEVKKESKDDDRKSKRVRLPTQPYQSPLPELNIIAKISKSSKSTPTKAADDKLIVFYKNEFLAVRNAEGGFYVCQAMQNIYKSSPRIRIRWLSQEEGKDIYSPDFYDHTDFDCILTNLNLDKVDKERFRLPPVEQQRTESILKRALDVEKGVSEKPPVTEEHPDGLDLSLFRDESQLKKSKSRSRNSNKKSNAAGVDSVSEELDDEEDDDDDDEEEEDDDEEDDDDDYDENEESEKKTNKKESAPKTSKRKKKSAKKKPPPPVEKKVAKTNNSGNKNTVQPTKKKTETRVGSKRKSSVSPISQPTEKRARKSDTSSQPSERTNKTRSAEVAAGAKSRRDRRSKSRK